MIEIITVSNDFSTNNVIDWLQNEGVEYKRYNTDKLIKKIPTISTSNKSDTLKRWVWKISFIKDSTQIPYLGHYIKKEIFAYWQEFIRSKAKILGRVEDSEPINLQMLENAKKSGFKIPDSIITSSKTDLINFANKHKDIICKALVSPINIGTNGVTYSFRTSLLINKDIDLIEDEFYPTYFQEALPREYEIRLFYLNGVCWAIAFIVNKSNQSSVDIWNIAKRREVPIMVPLDIRKKVIKFMSMGDFKIGSLDFMIVNKEWHFLEINPSGQYDFVSKRGNYHLDKEIAKELMK